jgi:pyruvate/2-oxoglutarate/acetoin dehydrogenase E1 component
MGLALESVLSRLNEEEVYLDVFYPLRMDFRELGVLHRSLSRTGKLLILEEGTETLNLSSEYIKRLVGRGGERVPICRSLASRDMPLPSAKYLEKQVIPGPEKILRAVLELYDA